MIRLCRHPDTTLFKTTPLSTRIERKNIVFQNYTFEKKYEENIMVTSSIEEVNKNGREGAK